MLLPVRPSVNIDLPEFLRSFLQRSVEIAPAGIVDTVNTTVVAVATTPWGITSYVALIWAVGALCFLGWHIIGHLRFMSIINRWSERIESPEIVALFNRTKRELGIRNLIGLKTCPCVKTPMMVGFVHAVVLLPGLDISLDELKPILKHELIHYKRKDLFGKAIMLLALSIHWFNPIAHFMLKQACSLCEISCDEVVLAGADEKLRARYGEAIIGIIRNSGEVKTALSTNFFNSASGMKKRIYSIMDMTAKRFSPALLIVTLVIAFCSMTAFAITPNAATANANENVSEIASKSDTPVSNPTTPEIPADNNVKENDSNALPLDSDTGVDADMGNNDTTSQGSSLPDNLEQPVFLKISEEGQFATFPTTTDEKSTFSEDFPQLIPQE
jgi:beta-lactamase regulating signal transducer with metallopeptidase domain